MLILACQCRITYTWRTGSVESLLRTPVLLQREKALFWGAAAAEQLLEQRRQGAVELKGTGESLLVS